VEHPPSGRSVAQMLSTLSSWYAFLGKLGFVESNPARDAVTSSLSHDESDDFRICSDRAECSE
jgi:site-specific recombinase XerD